MVPYKRAYLWWPHAQTNIAMQPYKLQAVANQ